MGQEVLDWLSLKLLNCYAPIFVHYDLDTLFQVSNLTREQVSRLAKECSDMYSGPHKQESPSLDRPEKELHFSSEIAFWQAIKTLAHNPLARTMAWRLEWFQDSDGDLVTLVRARNCLERLMELEYLFIMISCLMISNLVQLQTDFVTWSDYFRESYVFKVQECLAVVWQASLRTLGHNGRTIQRDFPIIFLAFFLQKSFVLILMSFPPENQGEQKLILSHCLHCLVTWCVAKYRPEYYTAYHIFFFTVALCGKLLVSSSSNLLIAASMIFLVTSYVVQYGPEYSGGYHVCMAMVSHAMQDNASGAPAEFVTLTIAPTFIFLFLFVRSLESSPKVVYGKKVRDKMMKFRIALQESSGSDPEALVEITEMCQEISGVLNQQRHDALQMLSLFGKARAYLDERVGRWSLRERKGKLKARQKCTDIDLLIANAGAINEPFSEIVTEIAFNSCSINHSAGLEFVAGPVKQPRRTLEKLVRRYRRDVGCLTDLVRCTVIADRYADVC
jgi:hypothetical protein